MRLAQVDAARGLAIVTMVLFHFLFDLNFLGIAEIDVYSGDPLLLALFTAGLFLLLVGFSLVLGRGMMPCSFSVFCRKKIARALQLIVLGLLITVATMIYPGEGFVIFGILSCIGVSMIIALLFVDRPGASAVAGVVAISLGILIGSFTLHDPWFLWLGLRPEGFYSLDYFPLLPWTGVVLLGVSLGHLLIPRLNATSARKTLAPLAFLGRHSLLIYLVHQPILLAILFMYA